MDREFVCGKECLIPKSLKTTSIKCLHLLLDSIIHKVLLLLLENFNIPLLSLYFSLCKMYFTSILFIHNISRANIHVSSYYNNHILENNKDCLVKIAKW